MERLLITGIAGGQGRLVAKRVADDFEVSGVDRVAWEGHPHEIAVHRWISARRSSRTSSAASGRPPSSTSRFVRHFRVDPSVRHDVNVAARSGCSSTAPTTA